MAALLSVLLSTRSVRHKRRKGLVGKCLGKVEKGGEGKESILLVYRVGQDRGQALKW